MSDEQAKQEAAEVNRLLALGTERMRPKSRRMPPGQGLVDVAASLHVHASGDAYLELAESADRSAVVLAIARAALQLVQEPNAV